MTVRVVTAAELGYNNLVRVDDRPFAVRAVCPGVLSYKGSTFPVVYVSGISAWGRVSYTFPAGQCLVAATTC